MIDELKEAIWEIVLACLVGAFFGLVVAQFLPNRENIVMAVFVGMIVALCLLAVCYLFALWTEARKERRRERINRRSGYSR